MIRCLEAQSPKSVRESFDEPTTSGSVSHGNSKGNQNARKLSTILLKPKNFVCDKQKKKNLNFDMRQQVMEHNLSRSLKGFSSARWRSVSESTDENFSNKWTATDSATDSADGNCSSKWHNEESIVGNCLQRDFYAGYRLSAKDLDEEDRETEDSYDMAADHRWIVTTDSFFIIIQQSLMLISFLYFVR